MIKDECRKLLYNAFTLFRKNKEGFCTGVTKDKCSKILTQYERVGFPTLYYQSYP
jgi:hypothetical protein